VRDYPAVVALAGCAGKGDHGTWNELIERYEPLPYAETSKRLGTPIDEIVTNRAQRLARMRRCAPLATLSEVEPAGGGDELDA
jgi:hypothetical protein